jgi:hypothetical protein
MILFGVVFTAIGVAARLGQWKTWYWRTRGSVYGYVPLGLLFILYAFNEQALQRVGRYYVLYQGLMVLLIGIGLWWSLRPPEFVKPTWVRWVEAYPQSVHQAMQNAVEDGQEWEPLVASREDLEAWVKRLRGTRARPKRRG